MSSFYGNGYGNSNGNNNEIIIDDTLTQSGQAADAKVTGDEITDLKNNKADINGTYSDMTVGNAEQLTSTQFVTDNAPYLYRTAGGSTDIGNRENLEIVGGSMVWNQKVSGVRDSLEESGGITITKTGADSLSITGTCTGATSVFRLSSNTITFKAERKYFVSIGDSAEFDIQFTRGANYTFGTLRAGQKSYIYGGASSDVNAYFGIRLVEGNTYNLNITPYLTDLTTMFGATIADYIYSLETATVGSGIAWLQKHGFFTEDYYEYTANTIKSVEGLVSHDTVGFNAFDLTTSKAKVVGGHEYEIVGTYTAIALDGEIITPVSGKFTPVHSGELTITGGNATTCVHLVWSGTRDGEYADYEKHSYPLDSTLTLRGVPILDTSNNLYYDGDVYAPDGTVTRRAVMLTLNGSEDWVQSATPGEGKDSRYFVLRLGNLNSVKTKYLSMPYYPYLYSSHTVPELSVVNSTVRDQAQVSFRPNAENVAMMTTPQFKEWLAENPVTIVYLLTDDYTTTETAEPYQDLMEVDDWGTEEFVTTSLVPVGHNTKYPANLRDKLQHLPSLADADGVYLVGQNGTQMQLVEYTLPDTDTTLSVSGGYADAKVTGDELTGVKEHLSNHDTVLYGSDSYQIEFENGTYRYIPIGSTLEKYYSGGYDKTRKVVATTTYDAPCNVHITAKTGYQFSLFTAEDGVIVDADNQITDGTLTAGTQYGITLRAEDGITDISEVSVSSIVDIEYEDTVTDTRNQIYTILPTDTASGVIAEFADGVDNAPIKDMTVNIEAVQSGSGDPAPDNVRPITGHTGVNIFRSGLNLLGGKQLKDNIKAYMPSATINETNKTIAFTAPASVVNSVGGVTGSLTGKFKENTVYTVIFAISKNSSSSTQSNLRFNYTDGTYTLIDGFATTKTTIAFQTNANKTLLSISKTNSGGTTTLYYNECGIFEGSLTVDDFVPYDGAVVPVTWETEAGTVYGGTLDPVTGVLTVNGVHVVLDGTETETWSMVSGTTSGQAYYRVVITNVDEWTNLNDSICSHYPTKTIVSSNSNVGFTPINSSQSGAVIAFRPDLNTYNTLTKWKEYVAQQYENNTPVTCVCQTSQSQTYQLTPAEVKTLLGQNYVWADTGNVDVTYRADIQKYIESKNGQLTGSLTLGLGTQNETTITAAQLSALLSLSTAEGVTF